MENTTDQEKEELVQGIKAKAKNILSQTPEEERAEEWVDVEIEPVVPDHNNLIASADIIHVHIGDDGDVSMVLSRTADIDAQKEFIRGVFLNHPRGPSIIEAERDITYGRTDPNLVESFFDAIQNMRPASISELNQLDNLLTRTQKGFRGFKHFKT